jgi:hypothetical protein
LARHGATHSAVGATDSARGSADAAIATADTHASGAGWNRSRTRRLVHVGGRRLFVDRHGARDRSEQREPSGVVRACP